MLLLCIVVDTIEHFSLCISKKLYFHLFLEIIGTLKYIILSQTFLISLLKLADYTKVIITFLII